MIIRTIATSAIAILQLTTSTSAEPTPNDYANFVSTVGAKSAKQYLSQSEINVPPSSLPLSEQSVILESRLQEYAALRNVFNSAEDAAGWATIGIGSVFGAWALYGGPQASVTVPATLFGAALVTTMEVGHDQLEAIGRESARSYLALHKDEIFAEVGVNTYEQLRSDPNRILQSELLVRDLQSRADILDDDLLKEFARDLMVDTIRSTPEALLEGLMEVDAEVNTVTTKFTDFVVTLTQNHEEVVAQLDKHSSALATVVEDVNELSRSVSNLNQRISEQGRDQAIIADFVFDEMPPDRKAAALRTGFLSERFECAPDEVDCDGPQLKNDLIDRFEKEADLQQTINEVTRVVAGINDVVSIAEDLGISNPALSQFANVGNAALNAVTAWTSGNPLGAIASVTGLFGKKKDPDAERFKIMMGYLQRHFEEVNNKLNDIISNQQLLFRSMSALSDQMDLIFVSLDRRLARMEYEQARMSLGIRDLIWQDWRSCNSVYTKARERGADGRALFVDQQSLRFLSIEAVADVYISREQNFLSCLRRINEDMDSLSNMRIFGNFLDARWALNEQLSDEVTQNGLGKQERDEWRGLLQQYEDELFAPSRTLAWSIFEKEGIAPAASLIMLAQPAESMAVLRAQVAEFRDKPFICFNASRMRDVRFYNTLCGDRTALPNQKALSLLGRPIIADMVLEISDWTLVVSQIADVYRSQYGVPNSVEKLIGSTEGRSRGEEIIERSILIMDVAIAVYNQMYGGPSAMGITEALDEAFRAPAGEAGDAARSRGQQAVKLMDKNPYLAENAVTLLMHRAFREIHRREGDLTVPSERVYRDAYMFAERAEVDGAFLLEGMFGKTLDLHVEADAEPLPAPVAPDRELAPPAISFITTEAGVPALRVVVEGVSATMPLPPPDQFVNGRFVFPPRFSELIQKRISLVDRLADYNLLSSIDEPAKRIGFALTLAAD